MVDNSLISMFAKVAVSYFPDFYSLVSPLDKSLWVLQVAKETNIAKVLTAREISLVMREVYEDSLSPQAIANALNRAGLKVHRHLEKGQMAGFEIMKLGKDFLSEKKTGGLELFYFEPGKQFGSKRLLSGKIVDGLKGCLKIVDPYCGERTLDVLNNKGRNIQFLTRLANLPPKDKSRLTREIHDFKSDNPQVEFRNYGGQDIHDRYIISDDALVLLGHSIGSLGGKESFAIALDRSLSQNIYEVMVENFNRRWKASTIV